MTSKKPLILSVEDMWERAFGKKKNSGQPLNLVVNNSDFRYIPACIVQTAADFLRETDDVEKVLRYIENGFYIFRESVCHGTSAPHYKVEGAYEWPTPAHFEWTDIDSVIASGEYIHGPIPENRGVVVSSDLGENLEEITEINFGDKGNSQKTKAIIREKPQWEKKITYKIDYLENVGFVFMQSWQQLSLRAYANPVYHMLKDLLKGKLPKNEAKKHLQKNLEDLGKTYKMPVGRYKKRFEKANADGFFFFV